MAAISGNGPPWWNDPPPGGTNTIDNSHTGATLPSYMDPQALHGELHLLRLSGTDDRPLPNAPFLIRKSIESKVGRIDGAFKESGGTYARAYALKVRSLHQLKLLLCMDQLHDGTNVKIVEHPTLNCTKCVVSCRDVMDLSDAELQTELAEQGVREIRRITRREGDSRINTPAIILTCKGTVAPESIDFGYIRCKTRPYYPNPMQCFNCWAFGHTKTRCQTKESVCGKCSQTHPISEDRNCSSPAYCKFCETNDHAISSRSCPRYKRENGIQRIKVDKGIPYPAAKRMYDSLNGGPSYAHVAFQGNEDILTALNNKIDLLTKQLAQKDKFIEELLKSKETAATPPSENHRIYALEKQMSSLSTQVERFISAVMPSATLPSCTTTPLHMASKSGNNNGNPEPELITVIPETSDPPAISPIEIDQPTLDPFKGILTDSENVTLSDDQDLTPRPSKPSGKTSPSKPTALFSKENSRKPAPKSQRISNTPQPPATPSKRSLSNVSPADLTQQHQKKPKQKTYR